MADTIALATLILRATKAEIYQRMLDIGVATGLVTETWKDGDPTRSLWDAASELLEAYDEARPAIAKGGLLGLASGAWLTLLLDQNFNVQRRPPTFATSKMTIVNATSEDFGTIAAEELVFKNAAKGATYRNTASFALGPLATVTLVDVEAEVAGSGGSAGIGDIDALDPAIPGVTVTNTTVATGQDEELDAAATERAKAKLEARSPAGARGSYDYFIRTPEEQVDGQTNVTRTRVVDDRSDGKVGIFVAGASGAVTTGDRDKAEAVIEANCVPHAVDAYVFNTTNVTLNVTYEVWAYDTINLTSSALEALIESSLQADIPLRPIGGDIIPPATSGKIYKGWLEQRILSYLTVDGVNHGFRCVVSTPAADVSLALAFNPTGSSTGEVAVLGTITATVHLIPREGAS